MEKKSMSHARNAGAGMMKRFALFIFLFCMLVAVMPSVSAAEEAEKPSGWQFGADVYGWMPTLGMKTPGGDNVKITFGDLIDDLQFTVMGGVAARKGRWWLSTDAIYMKLKDDGHAVHAFVGPRGREIKIDVDATVKLQAWVVTPAISYSIVDTDKVRLALLAGARYLWLKPELDLDITGPLQARDKNISDSGDVWDGIVGIRGNVNLDKNWYMPYYADMGTGESAFTWQAMAGFGYRISKVVDVVAAYRYLYYKFEDNKVIDKLWINGPLVGLRFRF